MSNNWLWRIIWDKQHDPEYKTDTSRYRKIVSKYGVGGVIDEKLKWSQKSIDRMISFGSLKFHRFDPARPIYKVGKKPPRRKPLSGVRFRPPKRRDGESWGPNPINPDRLGKPNFTKKEVEEIYSEIKGLIPNRTTEQRMEIAQSVILKILSGESDVANLEKVIHAESIRIVAEGKSNYGDISEYNY